MSIRCTFCGGLQGQESDSSEASVRGPRIKHVCRRAAVALGRNRAVFPDDMPTLSALPWEEREKILSSMGNDGETHLHTYSCIHLQKSTLFGVDDIIA